MGRRTQCGRKTLSTNGRQFRTLKRGSASVLAFVVFKVITSLGKGHLGSPSDITMRRKGNTSMGTT